MSEPGQVETLEMERLRVFADTLHRANETLARICDEKTAEIEFLKKAFAQTSDTADDYFVEVQRLRILVYSHRDQATDSLESPLGETGRRAIVSDDGKRIVLAIYGMRSSTVLAEVELSPRLATRLASDLLKVVNEHVWWQEELSREEIGRMLREDGGQ